MSDQDLSPEHLRSASLFASERRYELPNSAEELDALLGLAAAPPYIADRLGPVAGRFVDVMTNRRGLSAALADMRQIATEDSVPRPYVDRLLAVAGVLLAARRLREVLPLARILKVSVETAHHGAPKLLAETDRLFVQAVTQAIRSDLRSTDLKELEAQASEATASMVARARNLGDDELLASCLAVDGQFWWKLDNDAGSGSLPEYEQSLERLRRAEASLAEAADLRTGAARGRTLATLVQMRSGLRERGLMPAEVVVETAREALALIDRADRPGQWLSACRVLLECGENPPADPPDLTDIQKILESHGPDVACECLHIAGRIYVERREVTKAAQLLRDAWPEVEPIRIEREAIRAEVLVFAVHMLDEGAVPCREFSPSDAAAIFRRLRKLPPRRRLAASLHLALHCPTPSPAAGWVRTHAPAQVAGLSADWLLQPLSYGLGVVHARETENETLPLPIRFRCAVLAATYLGRLRLQSSAVRALHTALALANEWAQHVDTAGSAPEVAEASNGLEAILDACIHEAVALTAGLGSAGGEWILRMGEVLSRSARIPPVANPVLSLAHSYAMKGALTSEMVRRGGPLEETESLQYLRRQIAVLEEEEMRVLEADLAAIGAPAAPSTEELRMCAWLHEREILSGSTAFAQLRNLQSRYDDEFIGSLVNDRYEGNSGFRGLPMAQILGSFSEGVGLLDIYLGTNSADKSVCYVMLGRASGCEHWEVPLADIGGPVIDPEDPEAMLLLADVVPDVMNCREHVREPPGLEPVSEQGAKALVDAARLVAGLEGHLDSLRRDGCEHIVVCPHGPLMFLPFHLLPVGGVPLADDFLVTIIPSLGILAREPAISTARRRLERAVIVAPNGGVAFGLGEEPRLRRQAEALEPLTPPAGKVPPGQATPATALMLLQEARYVHVAAHGSALGAAPSFHCLYLDPASGSDGRLYAHDAARADLRGLELVTLCACETALGRVDPAGNLRGLTAAFLGAGADAVVATLWPVLADSASFFFLRLHSALAEGATRQGAFRAAQLATRSRYPAYRDWGAFTYIGIWD